MTDSAPSSPIALVGTIALLAAYVVAAWCVAAGIAGNARQSRRLVDSARSARRYASPFARPIMPIGLTPESAYASLHRSSGGTSKRMRSSKGAGSHAPAASSDSS